MDGDGEDFNLHWEEEVESKHIPGVVASEVICGLENVQAGSYSHMGSETIIQDTDQIAAENLMYLSQDVVSYTDAAELAVDPNVECVTEEVITDDWTEGQDRVEVPLDQFANQVVHIKEENDIDVPLPTDQDQYTAMRPWPCDFCSRRFRKKAALMNHMVAHQNDRPHACNLCGVRYVRKCDLMNHLKVHAMVPDNADPVDYEDVLENSTQAIKPKKKRGRRKKIPEPVEEENLWENMTSARTQQWSRRGRSPAKPLPPPTPPSPASSPSPPPSPAPPPADPSRPFVCRHCGVGFAREKALQSHSRVHGGDSPVECGVCGELCWSREALASHQRLRHPHQPPQPDQREPYDSEGELTTVYGDEPVECGVCGELCWSREALASHQRLRHPHQPPQPDQREPYDSEGELTTVYGDEPVECGVCGELCWSREALASHQRLRHPHQPPQPDQREPYDSEGELTTVYGDEPVECGVCGELCWSREALASHQRLRHPHQPPQPDQREPYDSEGDDDMEYQLSPLADSGSERAVYDTQRGPELFCQDCGVAFQRADLLRRHQAAAHSHKRHDSSSSTWAEHSCDVCGESCADALQLLAHAERHADRPTPPTRFKKMSRGRNNTSSSSSRQFPCRECGKVFGSRSSQQIHIRIHTGERPYACRFCWKAFADGGTLRKHERIHTGEKPYACAVCPRAFNQRVVLREHVRSHHSAPDRRANGGPAFCCVVCGRTLHTSAELVQHLIQHCDANTALKRQPQQTGPRKYKRRRKIKSEISPRHSWERGASPALSPPPRSPSPAPPPRGRKRRAAANIRARPKMIHTEARVRERTKQVGGRRPPRRPADDLRAIRPRSASLSPPPSPAPSPPDSPAPSPQHSPPSSPPPVQEGGPFKCEMCAEEFPRRDALLLHVPVHI